MILPPARSVRPEMLHGGIVNEIRLEMSSLEIGIDRQNLLPNNWRSVLSDPTLGHRIKRTACLERERERGEWRDQWQSLLWRCDIHCHLISRRCFH